jgi:hypothetical protein
MALPPDKLDEFPALYGQQISPDGVSLVGLVNENLTLNFRMDRAPNLDLPSLWRLAKFAVDERGPLFVFRYRENET